MAVNISTKTEAVLAEAIGRLKYDPLGLVMFLFPWGEPTLPDGSRNPLKTKTGPEDWQREELIALGEHMRTNRMLIDMGLDPIVYRKAIASGHGIGKSAFVAWVQYIFMSTRVDTRGAVTASTQFQLEDKTWPELAKWHNLAINKHWFQWTATTFSFKAYPEDRRKNYRITAASVSEQNTEAFQGLHNEGNSILVIFDEASGVVPKVWEVAEGAMTDGEAYFFAFGNPTQPDGEFADCFDKHSEIYDTRHIDSREVSFTNKTHLATVIKKYGADSDEAKIRVYGQFPSQSYNGFISVDAIDDAIQRDIPPDHGAALIMGIDVARFGDDSTVFGYRQGRNARVIPKKKFFRLSTTKITRLAITDINMYRPDAVVIESTGPGAGVIDQLRDAGYKVHEVHPGSAAEKFEHFVNKRAENWSRMRDWIIDEGGLPDDKELSKQLSTIKYTLDRHEQKIQMEPKALMKARGLPSPDDADTLSLTFSVKIARRDRSKVRGRDARTRSIVEDNPLGD